MDIMLLFLYLSEPVFFWKHLKIINCQWFTFPPCHWILLHYLWFQVAIFQGIHINVQSIFLNPCWTRRVSFNKIERLQNVINDWEIVGKDRLKSKKKKKNTWLVRVFQYILLRKPLLFFTVPFAVLFFVVP